MQRYIVGNGDALAVMPDSSRRVGAMYAMDNWTLSPQSAWSFCIGSTEPIVIGQVNEPKWSRTGLPRRSLSRSDPPPACGSSKSGAISPGMTP